MKIGIINFHYAHNCGAVLECLALQRYLETLGFDVQVINYRPRYGTEQYAVYPSIIEYAKRASRDYRESNSVYRAYRILRRSLQAVFRYAGCKTRKKRTELYDRFVINNLKLTREYKSIEELKSEPPVFDVYISGSDQIWNPYVTNAGLDSAYFLDFGNCQIKRISYAVSPCQLEVFKYKDQLKDFLNAYAAISLREEQLTKDFERVLNKKIEVCVDPTLLLQKEDYEEFEDNRSDYPSKYILVYGFEDRRNPDLLKRVIEIVYDRTNLPIIDISNKRVKIERPSRYIDAVSPGQFLSFISKAEYVITNSFHGTAFSIIYRKKFWSVSRAETSSRMDELMRRIGLENRLIVDLNEKSIVEEIGTPVDYSKAEVWLSDERERARQFLLSAIKTMKDQ